MGGIIWILVGLLRNEMMTGHPRAKRTSGDEASLQVWKDTRMKIVHEVQDGAAVRDESMEALGNWRSWWNPGLQGSQCRLSPFDGDGLG